MKSPLKPLAALVASLALVVVAGTSSAGAAPTTQVITIDNFAFAPADISIPVGSTVTWTNLQSARHTTTSDTGVWDSDVMASQQSFEFTFDQPGDFAYHCDIHPEMVGVIHVQAEAAAAPEEVIAEVAPAVVEEVPAAVVVVAEPPPAPTVAPAPTVKPQPAYVYPTPTPRPVSGYGY